VGLTRRCCLLRWVLVFFLRWQVLGLSKGGSKVISKEVRDGFDRESIGLTSSGSYSFLPENLVAHASGVIALGERLCSLPGVSESGTPLVWSVYK
jgi:hypothetical protein